MKMLVEAIWNGIISRHAASSLTDEQKTELDRRIEELSANPDDVISWDEAKDAALGGCIMR